MADDFPVPPGFEAIDCPGCGHAGYTQVREGRDWYLDKQRRVRVVRCLGCGLHYTNPRPAAELLPAYYPEDYPPHQSASASQFMERNGSLRSLVLRYAFGTPEQRPGVLGRALAAAVTTFRPAERFASGLPYRGGGRLLDFGCGNGKFIRRMASIGWEVTGLDMGERAVREVLAGGLRALHGTLPHRDLGPASFDAVTMHHSFEHVPDPRSVLAGVREVLVDRGLLLINVPNFAAWDIGYLGDASMGLQLPRHLLHFTPATLRDLLRRCGFSVLRVEQVCRQSWIQRGLTRTERHSPGRGDALLRNRFFRTIVSRFQQLRGRGNDLTIISQKA